MEWSREECVLVLELYMKIKPKWNLIDVKNPDIISLSNEISRTTNSIKLRMANYQALDDDYPGVGMRGYSDLVKEVWNDLHEDVERLNEEAAEAKKRISDRRSNVHNRPVDEGVHDAQPMRTPLLAQLIVSSVDNNEHVNRKRKLRKKEINGCTFNSDGQS